MNTFRNNSDFNRFIYNFARGIILYGENHMNKNKEQGRYVGFLSGQCEKRLK